MSELSDAIRVVQAQQYLYWDLVQKLAQDERQAQAEQDKFIVSLGHV